MCFVLYCDRSSLGIDPAARDVFWQVIERHTATYFCGHEHIFNISKHGKAWQVLVGSGGSPFEAKIGEPMRAASDRYYAWATVSIHASGAVEMTAYGFDEHFGSTRKLRTIKLAATPAASAH